MFCDIEPWSRKILAKHWPGVPIEEDVKELANEPERIPDCTILTAGYPCQPFSAAGKRRGTEDDRHIWPYILKIVASKRPTWCVFENVYGHVSLGLDQVLLDLEAEGYATRTFIVPAAGVDACHKRDRVWIVGYSKHNGQSATRDIRELQGESDGSKEKIKQSQGASNESCNVANSRCKLWEQRDNERLEKDKTFRSSCPISIKPSGERHGWTWDAEPNVGRVANGIPNRVDRLRGLGNAIVPQIVMQIGLTIKNLYNQEGETNEEV